MDVDVFLCHASEDKDAFVRPLATALTQRGVRVWFDEFSLKPGDSIRQSIDRGLNVARHCVVVISPRFFSRRWPSWELNGIVQRHLGSDREILVPIWLDITAAQVRRESPALSDIFALKASAGVAAVADQIVSVTGGIPVTVQSLADDDLVDRFLRMVAKLAGVDGKSVLWIAAVDDDLLYHVATIGFELRHADHAIPLKSSVSGYAVRERKQITLNADIESDDRFLTIDRIQSMATAPLFGINGDVFAVVSVASTARRVFSQAGDEQHFTTAAALAGPMLQPLVSARLATLKARRGA